jgi:UrcA family protein
MSTRFTQIALALALLAPGASAALADDAISSSETIVYGSPTMQTRIVEIHLAALNLASQSGQATLRNLIVRAANNVCGGPVIDLHDQVELRTFHGCYAVTMADAMDKMNEIIALAPGSTSLASIKVTGSLKR